MIAVGITLIGIAFAVMLVAAALYDNYISDLVRDVGLWISWFSAVVGLMILTVSVP